MKHYKAFYHHGGKHRWGGKWDHEAGWYWVGKRPDSNEPHLMSLKMDGHKTQEDTQKHADRDKVRDGWLHVWNRALKNMPCRIKTIVQWTKQEVGTTPLPTFIKASAKKQMKQVGGVVFKRETSHTEEYGRHNTLTRVLGMHHKTGKHVGKPNHHWTHNAMYSGVKPRNPARRELLLQLAGSNGNAIARTILAQQGIIHWYKS